MSPVWEGSGAALARFPLHFGLQALTTRLAAAVPRRLPGVLRRFSIALTAAAVLATAPAAVAAADAEQLLAQASENTLRQTPPTSGLSAQGAESGSLSDTPPAVGGSGKGEAESGDSRPAVAAAELPFTGADPRITLLLGAAALLTGAGLRLRTGDARDY